MIVIQNATFIFNASAKKSIEWWFCESKSYFLTLLAQEMKRKNLFSCAIIPCANNSFYNAPLVFFK